MLQFHRLQLSVTWRLFPTHSSSTVLQIIAYNRLRVNDLFYFFAMYNVSYCCYNNNRSLFMINMMGIYTGMIPTKLIKGIADENHFIPG